MASLLYVEDTISQLLPGSLVHTMVLLHLPSYSLSLRCRSPVVDVPNVAVHPSLCFNQ